MDRDLLVQHLNTLLQPERFKDYGPNGLQVEGRAEVRRIVTGVTASLALIEAAITHQADAILVHHGLFWRGQDGRITGWMRRRLRALLSHDINLLAYHLPLDAHEPLGNNAQLARLLGFERTGFAGEQQMVQVGRPSEPMSMQTLVARCERVMGRAPIVVGTEAAVQPERMLQTVAWCSGGAQGYFESAISAGADLYLTGEISEPQAHLARETGVAFLACGHHATERFGVDALGQFLAKQLSLEHIHVEIDNPA